MKVQEVMSKHVKFCHPNTSLAEAALRMWEGDCGALPVIEDAKVIGMVTDRDIAMAMAIRHVPASFVLVNEVMSKGLYACSPDEEIHAALKTMRKGRVRRLPVIDDQGELKGIVSINDIALHAQHVDTAKKTALAYEDVVNTFKAICEHHLPKAAEPLRQRHAVHH